MQYSCHPFRSASPFLTAKPAAASRRQKKIPGRIFAAPSWVVPGTLAANCAFLAGRVDEAGLLFLESAACLAYGAEDLPPFLADLSLRYHVHLPVDLPWETPRNAAAICAALLGKVDFLGASGERKKDAPLRAVLHPPLHDMGDTVRAARLLAEFADGFAAFGRSPASLLLENVRGNDLSGMRYVVRDYGFGVCLDIGHILAYGQTALSRDEILLERTALLHVNAPGTGENAGRHLPLTNLDAEGKTLCASLCRAAPVEAVVMLELFRWKDIVDSLPLVQSWLLPRIRF